MAAPLLETWVKSATTWQLRQFGALAVQEDLRLVEAELEAARSAPRSEASQRLQSDESDGVSSLGEAASLSEGS